MRTIRASQLCPGDVCAGSGARILRVVHQGLYARSLDDKVLRGTPFPSGKVEVMVEYPNSPPRVDYWNKATTVSVV